MRLTLKLGMLVGALLLTVVVGPVHGAPILDYLGGTASHRTDSQYTIGTLFRTGSFPLMVTHLGAQDSGPNGPSVGPEGGGGFFNPPIQVGLWNATGTTLLGSVGVLSSDPLNDSYRYHALTSPVILNANTNYLIGALVGGGIEWFEDNDLAARFAGLEGVIVENRFAAGGTLQAPVNNGGATLGRWGAANALAVAVPEPCTVVIWGLVGACLAIPYRRRIQRKRDIRDLTR